MKWRKIRRWVSISCGVALAAFIVAAWFVGGSLVASANRVVGPPPSGLNVVAATLSSDSGSRIATWYIPAQAENSQATVILLHPFGGNRHSMLERAELFHDAGYAIVMVDLQAHGESPGGHITVGFLERHDVRAAVDYSQTKNPGHRIAIVGCSLGGAAALLASPLDIDAMVLESVYPTISEAVRNRVAGRVGLLSYILSPALLCQLPLRLGISTSELCPIDHMADVGCPVLVACGSRDRHTTLAETQRLYASAAEPKKLVVFQGAPHTDLMSYNPAQYAEEVLGFLRSHLTPDHAHGRFRDQ
jgi:alpha-beta hydrolase superfamily lysophospholipase